MLAALLLAGLAVCGTNPSATSCDTTRIDVGIRLLRGGAAYTLVPHRGGYLFVARIVGRSAVVLYPPSPINQVSIWDNDTVKLVDTGESLRSADVTLIIHWSSSPFLLPTYSTGESWDNARLSETWSAIVSQTRKAKLRIQALDADLAGPEDAVVVVARMDEESANAVRQDMASPPAVRSDWAWRTFEGFQRLDLPIYMVTPCGIFSIYSVAGPNC